MIKNQSHYCLNVELTSKSPEDAMKEDSMKEEDNMLVVRTNELAEDLLIFSVHQSDPSSKKLEKISLNDVTVYEPDF